MSAAMKETHGGNIWEAAELTATLPEKIIDFSASINPIVSQKVVSAIKGGIRLITAYPDPSSKALRAALAAFHGLTPDTLAPGNGSTEFIHLLPQVFKPAKALIVAPAFSEYAHSLEKTGCKISYLTLRQSEGYKLDLARLAAELKKGFDALYLANPANPTGVLTPKETVRQAARLCSMHGALFVVDEAFMDFCEDESIKHEAVATGNIIALRSMTKFWAMAGLRSGYIISNADLIKKISSRLPPWTVNTLASLATQAGLTDNLHRKQTLAWLKRERAFLYDGIGAISGLRPMPTSVNYFTIKITAASHTASSLRRRLFSDGILIRDLSAMRGLNKKFFRVAVKSRKDNKLLLAALNSALSDTSLTQD